MVRQLIARVGYYFKGVQRKRLLLVVVGDFVLITAVTLAIWQPWRYWLVNEADTMIRSDPNSPYIQARQNYNVKFISIDTRSKKLNVFNTTLNAEKTYSYTNDTLFTEGLASTEIAADSIKKDGMVDIIYNTETSTVESVWRP